MQQWEYYPGQNRYGFASAEPLSGRSGPDAASCFYRDVLIKKIRNVLDHRN
jgi:hypothetical protein